MTTNLAQLSQVTDENGVIVQDNVPLGQWIEARERELDVSLDVLESETYHPHGCGVLVDAKGSVIDYWALYDNHSVADLKDDARP